MHCLMQGQWMGSEGKLLMKKELIVEICEGLTMHADLEFDYRAQLLIGTILEFNKNNKNC